MQLFGMDQAGEASPTDLVASGLSPEQVFDREWAQAVFDHALQQLECEFTGDGKKWMVDPQCGPW